MGLGALPTDRSAATWACSACTARAPPTIAVQEADLLICVGARFDDRVTGKLAGFAPARARRPPRHRRRRDRQAARAPTWRCAGDLGAHRSTALARAPRELDAWQRAASGLKAEPRAAATTRPATASTRRRCCAACRSRGGEADRSPATSASTRCGSRSTAASSRTAAHLTSGGLGTMGYGLPAAIGAQLACPGATVVASAATARS